MELLNIERSVSDDLRERNAKLRAQCTDDQLRAALEFGIWSCAGPTNDQEVEMLEKQIEETWQEYSSTLTSTLRWDAHHNRTYDPVETRAKEIYDFFEYKDTGTKPAWVPGGNSLMQDEARICARRQLRDAGHSPVSSKERPEFPPGGSHERPYEEYPTVTRHER